MARRLRTHAHLGKDVLEVVTQILFQAGFSSKV